MELQKNQENQPKFLKALETIEQKTNINAQETDLVILKEKVLVKPLTGHEEQLLKTQNVTIPTFVKLFNEIIYSKCQFSKNSKIKDYESFLKYLTPQDKALIIYALSLSTFNTLGTIGSVCEKCQQQYPADIKTEELWHPDSAPKPWTFTKGKASPFEYRIPQKVLNGRIIFNLKLPVEKERIELLEILEQEAEKNIQETNNIFSNIETISFLTDSIIIPGDDGEEDQILEDKINEILPFLKNLPLKIKDAIMEEIDLNIFDEQMPNLYQEAKCTKCGHINKIPINIETSFFRKALLLLGEI